MSQIIIKLRQRYHWVPPLIFQRCLDRAKSEVDLFDMLEAIPNNFPLLWNHVNRSWETADNFALLKISPN